MSSSAAATASVEVNSARKRPLEQRNHRHAHKRLKKSSVLVPECSNEEILDFDIQELLSRVSITDEGAHGSAQEHVDHAEQPGCPLLPEPQTEIEVTVSMLSSTGDGLALVQPRPGIGHVYVIPFAVPGDRVAAKVYKHFEDKRYSMTDFIRVVKPSAQRDDSLVGCQYFAKCSGCQFQMLAYPDQLKHKKTIIQKAYKNFSGLSPSKVPEIGDTIGSPLQYGYRTKLTPHFDGPPYSRRARRQGEKTEWPGVPPIGFTEKGKRKVFDVEDCPIGTDAVRLGMMKERRRVAEQISTYRNGATLLLRENTNRVTSNGHRHTDAENGGGEDKILENRGGYVREKTCITDPNAMSTEYVDDFVFENPAGAFFQNNNSILPIFTQYIRDHILPKDGDGELRIENLIDAYCGSGLFTITLSSLFKRSVGIDISEKSIACARKNAKLNNLPETQATFMAADAADLFAKIDFPGDETVVVIDPPRKGCDENFLGQLLKFSPARVVYVSCNVHTQARDVGILLRGSIDGKNGRSGGTGDDVYEIERLCGFDFFPQTSHVESVAVLKRRI